MSSDREERIRARAHEIWEREGRPEGRDAQHWDQAAREIDEEDAGRQADGRERGASGLSSGFQPGGTTLSGGPGASEGSIGTAGGSTAGKSSGVPKRSSGKSTAQKRSATTGS